MATMDNLQEAFAGESQANRKYLAFAKKADEDGLPQVAKLFRAAAEAETVHAHAHLRVMGGIKSTAENLETAVEGEGFEFQEMYPKYLAEAQEEGNKPAEFSIKNALAVEEAMIWLQRQYMYAQSAATLLREASPIPALYVTFRAVSSLRFPNYNLKDR